MSVCNRFLQFRKILAASVAATLLGPSLTWAFTPGSYSPRLSQPPSTFYKGPALSIPQVLGAVTGHFSKSSRTVICIQDLHCNEEVQKNIAGLLQYLKRKHGLTLIGQEGAWGRVDVSVLRDFPVARIRRAAADYFVKQGKLTGADYFAGLAERPMRLEGIEDRALYEAALKNAREFLNSESQGLIADLREKMEALKAGLYSPALRRLDRRDRAFRAGELELFAYLEFLWSRAQSLDVGKQAYPAVKRALEVKKDFFSEGAGIEPDALYAEVEKLDRAVRAALYDRPEQQALDEQVRRLEIIEKLMNISATREELREFRAHPEKFAIKNFAVFLQTMQQTGSTSESVEVLEPSFRALDESLKKAEGFYRLADLRSRAFVENLTALMDREHQDLAVMINGGFHTPEVLHHLQERGISYLAVKPRLTRPDAINPYFELLKGRRTPVEELLEKNQTVLAVKNAMNSLGFIRQLGLALYGLFLSERPISDSNEAKEVLVYFEKKSELARITLLSKSEAVKSGVWELNTLVGRTAAGRLVVIAHGKKPEKEIKGAGLVVSPGEGADARLIYLIGPDERSEMDEKKNFQIARQLLQTIRQTNRGQTWATSLAENLPAAWREFLPLAKILLADLLFLSARADRWAKAFIAAHKYPEPEQILAERKLAVLRQRLAVAAWAFALAGFLGWPVLLEFGLHWGSYMQLAAGGGAVAVAAFIGAVVLGHAQLNGQGVQLSLARGGQELSFHEFVSRLAKLAVGGEWSGGALKLTEAYKAFHAEAGFRRVERGVFELDNGQELVRIRVVPTAKLGEDQVIEINHAGQSHRCQRQEPVWRLLHYLIYEDHSPTNAKQAGEWLNKILNSTTFGRLKSVAQANIPGNTYQQVYYGEEFVNLDPNQINKYLVQNIIFAFKVNGRVQFHFVPGGEWQVARDKWLADTEGLEEVPGDFGISREPVTRMSMDQTAEHSAGYLFGTVEVAVEEWMDLLEKNPFAARELEPVQRLQQLRNVFGRIFQAESASMEREEKRRMLWLRDYLDVLTAWGEGKAADARRIFTELQEFRQAYSKEEAPEKLPLNRLETLLEKFGKIWPEPAIQPNRFISVLRTAAGDASLVQEAELQSLLEEIRAGSPGELRPRDTLVNAALQLLLTGWRRAELESIAQGIAALYETDNSTDDLGRALVAKANQLDTRLAEYKKGIEEAAADLQGMVARQGGEDVGINQAWIDEVKKQLFAYADLGIPPDADETALSKKMVQVLQIGRQGIRLSEGRREPVNGENEAIEQAGKRMLDAHKYLTGKRNTFQSTPLLNLLFANPSALAKFYRARSPWVLQARRETAALSDEEVLAAADKFLAPYQGKDLHSGWTQAVLEPGQYLGLREFSLRPSQGQEDIQQLMVHLAMYADDQTLPRMMEKRDPTAQAELLHLIRGGLILERALRILEARNLFRLDLGMVPELAAYLLRLSGENWIKSQLESISGNRNAWPPALRGLFDRLRYFHEGGDRASRLAFARLVQELKNGSEIWKKALSSPAVSALEREIKNSGVRRGAVMPWVLNMFLKFRAGSETEAHLTREYRARWAAYSEFLVSALPWGVTAAWLTSLATGNGLYILGAGSLGTSLAFFLQHYNASDKNQQIAAWLAGVNFGLSLGLLAMSLHPWIFLPLFAGEWVVSHLLVNNYYEMLEAAGMELNEVGTLGQFFGDAELSANEKIGQANPIGQALVQAFGLQDPRLPTRIKQWRFHIVGHGFHAGRRLEPKVSLADELNAEKAPMVLEIPYFYSLAVHAQPANIIQKLIHSVLARIVVLRLTSALAENSRQILADQEQEDRRLGSLEYLGGKIRGLTFAMFQSLGLPQGSLYLQSHDKPLLVTRAELLQVALALLAAPGEKSLHQFLRGQVKLPLGRVPSVEQLIRLVEAISTAHLPADPALRWQVEQIQAAIREARTHTDPAIAKTNLLHLGQMLAQTLKAERAPWAQEAFQEKSGEPGQAYPNVLLDGEGKQGLLQALGALPEALQAQLSAFRGLLQAETLSAEQQPILARLLAATSPQGSQAVMLGEGAGAQLNAMGGVIFGLANVVPHSLAQAGAVYLTQPVIGSFLTDQASVAAQIQAGETPAAALALALFGGKLSRSYSGGLPAVLRDALKPLEAICGPQVLDPSQPIAQAYLALQALRSRSWLQQVFRRQEIKSAREEFGRTVLRAVVQAERGLDEEARIAKTSELESALLAVNKIFGESSVFPKQLQIAAQEQTAVVVPEVFGQGGVLAYIALLQRVFKDQLVLTPEQEEKINAMRLRFFSMAGAA